MTTRLSLREYRALAEVRYRIRAFLTFSEDAARRAGVEPQQHQLLLAIKGLPAGGRATIKAVAERLQIQHHSAVELATRAVTSALIVRRHSAQDAREVTLHLTARGARILESLSREHRHELDSAATHLGQSLRTLKRTDASLANAR
jgi:DNA-binding MarR family transcriptional regulator